MTAATAHLLESPRVTVVVPMYDEALDIEGCIEAIASQDWPRDLLQLVLVDGASSDDTVARATAAAQRAGLRDVVLVRNPARRTSVGLNRGLAAATGEYLVRVDARSRVQPDHVRRVVTTLATRADVGVAGGAQVAVARSNQPGDRAIARALNHRWLMGLARYRGASTSGPADTVWMGAFRTADLQRLGGWSETHIINEDYDLNTRVRQGGGLVWYDAGLRSGYLARRQIRLVARQYLRFGRAKGTLWRAGARPNARQAMLVAAPPMTCALGVGAVAVVGVVPVTIAALVAAVVADLSGSAVPANPIERVGALAVNLVIAGSWWIGTVQGLLLESDDAIR
jgi:succinoglycan biosynthesis protein ExoA